MRTYSLWLTDANDHVIATWEGFNEEELLSFLRKIFLPSGHFLEVKYNVKD
jgi:hypothetical protein